MDDLFTAQNIATVGFPAIMCVWLLHNGRQTISDNTKSNNALTEAIAALTAAIGTQSARLDHIASAISVVDNRLAHLTELVVEHRAKFERTD